MPILNRGYVLVNTCNQYIFLIFLLFTSLGPVYSNPDIRYFEKSGIVQRMSWEAGEDVLKYELIIEKWDKAPGKNSFVPILSVTTGETNAELSLPPGEYRYRIIVYDLLGRMWPPTEWATLTVIPALQPEIISVNPPEVTAYGGFADATIDIKGSNLLPDADIYFMFAGGDGPLPLDKCRYIPNENGDGAKLRLNGLPLKEGFYDIVITNPGDISGSWHNFKVTGAPKKIKPFNLSFAEAYNLLIPSYGLLNEYMGQDLFPAGASFRFGINSKNKSYGVFGIELQVFWHYFFSTKTVLMSGHLFNAQANLLYQKRILWQKAALNVRVGGGLAYFLDLQIKIDGDFDMFSAGNETLLPVAAASLMFTWFFHEPFFLESGAEFIHIFSAEKPQSAYIRPSLTLGFQI
jgi:hypothetical protein